jgi:small subunit ribosomal protein S20
MPNIESARKRMRQSAKANARNTAVRTRLSTTRRLFFEKVAAGDREAAGTTYRTYCSVLDKAAKSGVVKGNTAARRKTRAANQLRAMAVKA